MYDTAVIGSGINGAPVTLTPDAAVVPQISPLVLTTAGGGYYEAHVFGEGNYVLSALYSDYIVTPYSFDVTNTLDTYDFDFGLYALSGYVNRYGTSEGINGVDVAVTGGSLPIDLTTANDTSSNPGYYETRLGHVGGRTYTVGASNP